MIQTATLAGDLADLALVKAPATEMINVKVQDCKAESSSEFL